MLLTSPIGDIIPITISTAKAKSSAGVKNFPIISTTFDGFIVKNKVNAKNTTDTITGTKVPTSPIIGDIPIS